MFAVQSSYTVFAHLLRHVTALPSSDHQLLVGWFKTLEIKRFSALVQHLLQFITVRRFPPADMSLPPMSKSKWWVPTATRVLALLNVANNTRSLPLIHYTDFYNSALDHLDLMDEYMSWQAPERPDRFSFCQYPFILSIVAKRYILTKDSEQQMILTARRSLVAKVSRHQIPDIEVFFLNISVRRAHLVPDSLREIGRRQRDLKKKLKVTFEGEPGLDMGGLTKEWFQLLIRQPDYGMFVYHSRSRCYWFSLSQSGNLREYNLIGVLMGLAVYNSIILDLHFPHVCYRKLLSPPVVPNFEYVPVGLAREPSTIDLAEIMPVSFLACRRFLLLLAETFFSCKYLSFQEVASSLKDLLVHEGDVEEDFCMCFQVSVEEFGKVKTYNLKESGDQLPVTNENREEFVKLYLDFVLNSGIYEQFRAFYLGFHSVCASNALIMLRPEEVEMLVCGSPNCDLSELKKVVEYDGFTSSDPDILDFWEILLSLSTDLQKKFLLFTTGSDRIPVGGISEMTFKISAQRESLDMLPQAHTCFNQLVLPTYKNRNIMREKLTIAISNAEGFGLE
ncbi:unnamed protein product [Darwinula stevensoni]|uniref:HECT-type E3 ubiquitin transferase n=1 Tax=Darwinula stevensoni TaxID=69355 RepID=A0A7R8XFF6_9CRUS|nr:unnamed protein product [Darwinula stevensoni]CAG0888791.1 unnamed protein product [Darwinula stevensoni]